MFLKTAALLSTQDLKVSLNFKTRSHFSSMSHQHMGAKMSVKRTRKYE